MELETKVGARVKTNFYLDNSRDNFIELILTKSKNFSRESILDIIDIVDYDIDKVINKLPPLEEINYYKLDTSYDYLDIESRNSTLEEILVFGSFVAEFVSGEEVLLIQAILEEFQDYSLYDIIDFYQRVDGFGAGVILEEDLFEYAYLNGVVLDEEPGLDTDQIFVDEVLIPNGYSLYATSMGLRGYVDTDLFERRH